jgi:single-stranded-DNA-specific exonuclease
MDRAGCRAERLAAALVQRAGLEHGVAAVLAHRGVPPEAAEAYLTPSLRDLLPDPSVLKDMDAASAAHRARPAAA